MSNDERRRWHSAREPIGTRAPLSSEFGRVLVSLAVCLLLVATALPVLGQETASEGGGEETAASAEPAATGARTHDGFFLRLGFPGVGGGVANSPDVDVTIRGGGTLGSVGIGGAVVENFILHAQLFGGTLINPDIEIGRLKISEVDGRLRAFGLGFGVTGYLDSINLYFSGSAGFAVFDEKHSADVENTEPGFGADFLVGYEWWVSDNWGIGIAGHLLYLGVEVDDRFWNTFITGPVLSATYN